MNLDRENNAVCQNATKVIFACFVAECLIATIYFSQNHVGASRWFTVGMPILLAVMCCAIATYIRPRGIAAFITSTAFVALFAIFGLFFITADFFPNERGFPVLAVVGFASWVAWGIARAVRDYRQTRK